MFFQVPLEKHIQLPPHCFGPNLRRTLLKKLYSEVEGTCSPIYGYIIAVTGIRLKERTTTANGIEQPEEDISLGKISESGDNATFLVKYDAIVFKPFQGEILDAIVTQVSKIGFFAEAGPLKIFVSSHCIPEGMEFDPTSNAYASGSIRVAKDCDVRIKITGTQFNPPELFAIGTIREDFTGPT